MIELRDRQFLIDGAPRFIVSGEIHYFRLDPAVWPDRIARLKAAGANAVASYIPWLCHEVAPGHLDFDGHTRPSLALGAFIDQCRDQGLWFFARPGPFVMAELRNEGLPDNLYEAHPEIVPVSWDGAVVPSRTVDYLAPAYLAACRTWYAAVGRVLAPRLVSNGGNVIAIQLDNEIGMLSWVTNAPDLTDLVIADFWHWLERRYGAAGRAERYPPERYPPVDPAAALRAPAEAQALPLLRDLGHYMRDRFARYVAALRGFAEASGMGGLPFVVNIHGTADGRGLPFPIGISQLYEAYTQAPGYLAGSDIYLGDATAATAVDLYLINAFMAAVNRPEQPLTSVEFECGDGNYGGDGAVRYDPSAADFKLRLCVAQGNRLVNLYLFAGGTNYRLDRATGDGNDRIGFTGERHGAAAPVGPEGTLNSTYPRLARTVSALMAVGDKLAVATEEWDGVTLAFIPDYFMTESRYPASAAMEDLVAALWASRFGGPREVLARAMVQAGYRFGALDVQNRPLDPATTPLLALASARYMDAAIQRKLVAYLERGGHLLLHGEVPLLDMEGQPCAILADRLGLRPLGRRQSSPRYHLSLNAAGWAAPRAELRAGWAQVFAPDDGALLDVYGADEIAGFERPLGAGRVIAFTADLPCDVDLFTRALTRLGATPRLTHGCPERGIVMTSTVTPAGERFLHLLNLDGFDKALRLTDAGRPLLPDRHFVLRAKEGVMLPFGVAVGPATIVRATAEIAAVTAREISFRLTQEVDTIELRAERTILPDEAYDLTRRHGTWLVTSRRPAIGGVDRTDLLTVRFA